MKTATSWHDAITDANPWGFVRPFLSEAARHLYKLLSEPEYRRYYWLVARYGGTPRFQRRTVRVGSLALTVPDVASLLSAYREIFVEEIYAFPTGKGRPVILDCGANIGLSVLYYKRLFPDAKVVAYEADPVIFGFLQENVLNNGLTGVELHNAAIWSGNGTVEFSVEGADGGRIGSADKVITVPAVDLAGVIRGGTFDFIKIDIEGAEYEALKGCGDCLGAAPYVFVEFHSFQDKQQDLGKLLTLFENNGFRVHIHPPFIQKRPFMGIHGASGMDMQLNLFFWKKTA